MSKKTLPHLHLRVTAFLPEPNQKPGTTLPVECFVTSTSPCPISVQIFTPTGEELRAVSSCIEPKIPLFVSDALDNEHLLCISVYDQDEEHHRQHSAFYALQAHGSHLLVRHIENAELPVPFYHRNACPDPA